MFSLLFVASNQESNGHLGRVRARARARAIWLWLGLGLGLGFGLGFGLGVEGALDEERVLLGRLER